MSWLFSQALVEEYLGDTSLDGEQSVQLNGGPTQQAYCASDKMKEFSRLSRFGMTFKPLTEDRGEELLTLYLEGFHAKTSALLEKGRESMESDQECGEKWRGSFTKYDPDSSLWKTHQCSLLGDLDEFSETWPQWGLMRDGECWEQRTLEQTIRGTGFGLWPTPTASTNGPSKIGSTNPRGVHSGNALATAVSWRTPTVNDSKSNGSASQQNRQSPNLNAQVGGPLNPMWVEWLMGWPLGWTDLKPLVMDKSHYAPPQHGDC